MVSEPSPATDPERPDSDPTGSAQTETPAPPTERTATEFPTVISALIGGVVGIVLAFIPFSTVLGGGVSGYLEGGQPKAGLKVGAIAGAIMLVPFLLILIFALFLLGFAGVPRAVGLVGILVLLFVGAYTVGLGALGGYLGVYVKNEL
ncbi:MAG: DUF5518 domain-containing protein [Halobacteriota archaeon]|uniref:DUF5518 domain-containing protein n=1 Tax=Natronomonas sp. TaxID=2184060 RepID=UPI003976A994